MHRRALALLLVLLLLPASVYGDSAALRLIDCLSKEEAADFLDFADTSSGRNAPIGVTRGRIRFVAQNNTDPGFVKDYWLGGAEGSDLDLTQKLDKNGKAYSYYCNSMCTRAAYSMALSYLGIDLTPGAISAMVGERDIDEPYDAATDMLSQIERAEGNSYRELDDMLHRYLTDTSWSPIMLTLVRANGWAHALLIVGRDTEGRLIVVDPAPYKLKGVIQRVQLLRLNVDHTKIYRCTCETYKKATISGLYQWHRTDGK